MIYTEELKEIGSSLTGEASLQLEDALEVMHLLDAAAESYKTGKPVTLK